MNERLEQLAKQATIRVNNPIVNSDGKIIADDWEQGVSLSKFAALIVEECAQVCWSVSELEHKGYTVSECSKRMRKHFGIKE